MVKKRKKGTTKIELKKDKFYQVNHENKLLFGLVESTFYLCSEMDENTEEEPSQQYDTSIENIDTTHLEENTQDYQQVYILHINKISNIFFRI